MNMSTAITKSVRLSSEESKELAELSQKTAVTEATLMKQWIREGMLAKKVELAIQAYMDRKTDLRGGAAMAGVSYNRFMREVQNRNIVILEDEGFTERLAYLADALGDATLQEAVNYGVQ
jgi:predicted DNA-binding protein